MKSYIGRLVVAAVVAVVCAIPWTVVLLFLFACWIPFGLFRPLEYQGHLEDLLDFLVDLPLNLRQWVLAAKPTPSSQCRASASVFNSREAQYD